MYQKRPGHLVSQEHAPPSPAAKDGAARKSGSPVYVSKETSMYQKRPGPLEAARKSGSPVYVSKET